MRHKKKNMESLYRIHIFMKQYLALKIKYRAHVDDLATCRWSYELSHRLSAWLAPTGNEGFSWR